MYPHLSSSINLQQIQTSTRTSTPYFSSIMASSFALNSPNSTIKELCSSRTLSSLPSTHTLKDSGDGEVVEDVDIPVIDFCKLTEGTPEERAQVVQDLRRTCEEWGFFVLVNHGVPEELMNSTMTTLKGFFDLPAEEKREYADTHPMSPIRYGTSFNTKVEDVKYWRDYVKIITHPEFHSPAKPPELREVLQEYAASTRELGRKLLGGIWESLGLDENYMNGALNLDSLFQIVVCNLYPACPQPELAMGLPPHSDHGLLTVLYQNDVNGLELKYNGKWVRVKPSYNSYLINTGDHMEIVSNGKYRSILHRAVVNGKNTRMSIVSVTSPSLDTVVSPAPQLVSSESPAAFRGIKYGEFMEYQQSNKLKDKSVLDMLRL